MGAVVGLCFGLGAVLVLAATSPRARTVPPRGRLRSLLDDAGLPAVGTTILVAACACSGLLGALVAGLVSRTAPVALVLGCLSAWAPVTWLRGRARRRHREYAEAWPESIDHLSSAVRAGLSLPEGLAALGHRGPAPLRPAFVAFAHDYEASGRFGEALDRLKARLADPVGDQVIESLRIAREVGGSDLGRLLRTLSSWLRDDARTRAELEARQAWVVNGARLSVAAPWLVLGLLCFQPEVIHRYATTTGTLVLLGGAGIGVVAYRLMLRLGRLPVQQRVLQ